MRINARLDDDLARKFKELQQLTQAGTTEIVKTAIELYYSRIVIARDGGAAKALGKSGFVGCGAAGSDLSSRYKESLRKSLEEKA